MPRRWAGNPVDAELFYRSYVATYLERDIRELAQVADESEFLRFMTAVAARTARPVVYEELARDVGVSAPTAKKWLSVLVSSGIVVLVQPFSNNVLTRMVKMPLLHMLDTGLAAYLLSWSSPEALERGAASGQFFESHVFAEIYKSYLNAGLRPPVFYYRDRDKKEIDLLLFRDQVPSPIEVKKSASPGKGALKNFRVLDPLVNAEPEAQTQLKIEIGDGAVICMSSDVLPLDAHNTLVPVWLI